MGNRLDKGFTLIELMVTISVVAILATIAIPSFQNFIRQTRVTTQATDFITVLNYARSEAIKQNRAVTVCKSTDLATCAVGGSWAQGWIAFVDVNKDGAVSAADTLLRVHSALSGGSSLVGGATISNWIQYAPTGISTGNGGATANGVAASQLVLCPIAPANFIGRTIEIGFTGRVKSTTNTTCP